MKEKAIIVGTGSYLPERVLSNADLEKMVETSDEWIVSRTGMKERRIAAADEFSSHMGEEASRRALAAAGIEPGAVQMVICATTTPDHAFPSTACLIQGRLGMTGAAALDIQAACSGFIYALSLAKGWIEAGLYETVLVVAAEKISSLVNYKDRNTCVLFGDGAAAAVVRAAKPGVGRGLLVNETCLGADGLLSELVMVPAGGSAAPASQATVEAGLHYLKMDGKEVFKHAVRRMEGASKECLDRMGLKEGEISWYVPHQANMRIIEAIAKRFQVPMEKVYLTIQKYGNTSASSLGITLDELLRNEKLVDGEHLLLTAFGAGLTWGASVLTQETL